MIGTEWYIVLKAAAQGLVAVVVVLVGLWMVQESTGGRQGRG